MALDKLTQITSTGINSTTPLTGINVTGIITASSLSVSGITTGAAATFDSVDVLGVLTYDDVTNVDALGIVTARSGIHVTGGDVGIGTNNPGSRLDVRNASGTNPLLSLHHSNADVEGEVIRVGRTDIPAIRYHSIKAQHGGAAAANYITFNLHDGSSTTSQSEILRLRGDGNIGIGTDNLSTKLHVEGSQNTLLHLESTDAFSGITMADTGGSVVMQTASGYLRFLTGGDAGTLGTNSEERLRIASSGNVGIGTDDPSAAFKLHVCDVGGTIAFHNATQSNTIRYANNNTTAEWSAGTSRPGLTNAGDYYSIAHYGTDSTWRERFTIDSGGLIKTNQNSIEFGSNGLRLVGTNDVATYGWASEPGIYATGAQDFRMHSASGEMDLYVDGFGYFVQGVKGAFVDANAYLQTTMSAGATYTWNPGSGIPANVWVSMNIFCSSMDADQSDHFDIIVGPNAHSGNTWGDTYAANTPSNDHSIVTHPGDSQSVLMGHYGKWDHVIAKSDSNGDLVFAILGSNGGSGLNVRIQGYWMDKDSTSAGG